MDVGLLITRVELTGHPADPLRARCTGRLRLDRPETERAWYAASRPELHAIVDRWLDSVLQYHDDAGGR
jgi:hypothetical protein